MATKKQPTDEMKIPVELGKSGLDVQGGQISEEFLSELQGEKGLDVYREMSSNSPIVGAILFAIRNLIRQVEWSCAPASADPEDVRAADFLTSCKEDMNHTWGEFIDECLSMLIYGFALMEPVYKRRIGRALVNEDNDVVNYSSKYSDGHIGWAKFAQRGQTTVLDWDVDKGSELRGFVQNAPPEYEQVYIPAKRLLHFRPSGYKNNPEGMSVLRTAYRAWHFAKNIENIEGIGIERNLVGIPVVKVPPILFDSSATEGQQQLLNQFKDLVKNIHVNEQTGVVMPAAYDDGGNPLYTLELLQSGGTRPIDTNAVIQRWDQRIAQTLLADFVLIGHAATGSYALSSSKTSIFTTAIGTWLESIRETLNRYAIPRLFKLNPQFAVRGDHPTFEYGDIETPDLAELSAYITSLVGAGFPLFPTATGELEDHLMRVANLPVTSCGEDGTATGDGDDEFEDDFDDLAPPSGEPIDPTQVASLLDIVTRMNSGEIPRESAKAILLTAFPMSEDTAESILGTSGGADAPSPAPSISAPAEE